MGVESPITSIPGTWADRHPVVVTALICAALAAFVLALVSTHARADAFDASNWTSSKLNYGIVQSCSLIIGQPPILTIDTCKRTISAAPDVTTDEAAAKIIDALRPYLAGMSLGP